MPLAFTFDPALAGWRIVAGRALVVSRAAGRLHRLDRTGTAIWRLLVAASPTPLGIAALGAALSSVNPAGAPPIGAAEIELFLCDLELSGLVRSVGAPEPEPRATGATQPPATDAIHAPRSSCPGAAPRHRRLSGAWEVTEEIEPAPGTLARRVGGGWLLRSHDGELAVLSGAAASTWDLLSTAPRTFVELLDDCCDRFPGDGSEAVALGRLLLAWHESGVVRGLERVERLGPRLRAAGSGTGPAASPASTQPGTRTLGRLELTARSGPLPTPPRLGAPSAPRDLDAGAGAAHVAIVCQYGIQDLAPGVEPYTQRCLARLRRLDQGGAPVDLVILAGGGRHGASELREAESVIDRYRAVLPGRALWVEQHSRTTWENLQASLEMLHARGLAPRRISVLGDRARAEKLRLACWIAKRRFAPFRAVSFRVLPIVRPRFTWRDRRSVQLLVGSAQILEESRDRRLAAGSGTA